MTIDSGYCAARGAVGGNFSFQFKTQPLMVSSTGPFDGQVNVSRDAPVEVTFNARIDTAALLTHVTFDPPVDSIVLTAAATQTGGTACAIRHAPFIGDTLYTITLGGAVTDIYGEPMGRAFTLRFGTEK